VCLQVISRWCRACAGVIEIHDEDAAPERVFVRGGFAEVTNETCVVLAEEAVPVAELDRPALEACIHDTEEDLAAAATDEDRHHAEGALDLLRDMLAALS
jgi:F-type H+-transporting ATPase subunit epsilon